MMNRVNFLLLIVLILSFSIFIVWWTNLPKSTFVTAQTNETITFAAIGDFGEDHSTQSNVATMMQSWNPDFIITMGPVHFFVLNSNDEEPDGISSTSVQAQWLQNQALASTSRWQIVSLHHAPFSSSNNHGSIPTLQWPYASWGIDAVLAGHDHTYERLFQDGIVYFVNGLGGRSIYCAGTSIEGSQFQYNDDYGAMRITADSDSVTFEFLSIDDGADGGNGGTLIDSHTINWVGPDPTATPVPDPTSTPEGPITIILPIVQKSEDVE